MIPPTDEEVRTLVGVESEEELLGKVKEQLEEDAQKRETSRIESELLDRVLTETPFELPDAILEQQTHARLAQLHERMQAQGVPDEQIHEQTEEQRETAREEAEKGMRALLVVEALGKQEGLLVTDEELQAELVSIAERNNAEVDEVRKYYAENNLGQQMAIEILERKVRTFLRENATTEAE
jgi:trigger factor